MIKRILLWKDKAGLCLFFAKASMKISKVTYELSILPLIRHIKLIILATHQPWYADDEAIMTTWLLIVEYFDALTIHGLRYGFFLQPKN